jgi:hypothetical protein
MLVAEEHCMKDAVGLLAKVMVRQKDDGDLVAQLTQIAEAALQHLDRLGIQRLELMPFASECCVVSLHIQWLRHSLHYLCSRHA